MSRCCLVVAFFLLTMLPVSVQGQSREQKVRQDRKKVVAEGFWIYNDLEKGFAEAKQTGKPMVVVLRCIPCVECVKLDDDLVDRDPEIRPLLEKFVCVRIVSTNGLDLSLFQYDTDQSFAVFMLNADGTVYGRFGTRSHHTEWYDDVSLKGMAQALRGALELHQDYPRNKKKLSGKRGKPLEFSSPEKYPSLKKKYKDSIDFENNVVRSCIHCHQIGDARRAFYRKSGKVIPEQIFFPYPHPKTLGLILNPDSKADVKEVLSDSLAQNAGLKKGDQIRTISGQPILSIADVQWVLDQTSPGGATLSLEIERAGEKKSLSLQLPEGWRRKGDLSWRVSSWEYRRIFLGGLKLGPMTQTERKSIQLPRNNMGLKVEHVGQYGLHAVAKKAGVRKGDIITGYDGRTNLLTESDLFFYGNRNTKVGDHVVITALRNGRPVKFQIRIQD